MTGGHYPVVIVGAGPVGLLLGNILGAYGIRCMILERKTNRSRASMAIGVMPPSLEILQKLGLADNLVSSGLRVERAIVHENQRRIGEVSFRPIAGEFPFILSIPQWRTIEVLRTNLQRFPHVSYLECMDVQGFKPGPNGSELKVLSPNGELLFQADYIAGCDGYRSTVRNQLGLAVNKKAYDCSFVMADFSDNTGFGSEAHLFFGPHGSVESFPLPGGLRRWICQSLDCDLEGERHSTVEMLVQQRCGINLVGSRTSDDSAFSPNWMLCRSYYRGNIALCGDSAHVMSPIGGQGMNTGFADAELLGFIYHSIINQNAQAEPLFSLYNSVRKRAFRVAAKRAERGMWLGTRQGDLASQLRGWFIQTFLTRLRSARKQLAAYFAMQTIPYNHLGNVPNIQDLTSR